MSFNIDTNPTQRKYVMESALASVEAKIGDGRSDWTTYVVCATQCFCVVTDKSGYQMRKYGSGIRILRYCFLQVVRALKVVWQERAQEEHGARKAKQNKTEKRPKETFLSHTVFSSATYDNVLSVL